MEAPSTLGSLGPRAQLMCEMCKRRKVKCDKLRPCTNCRRSNAICVPVERARLPRGRSGKKSTKHARDGNGSDLHERMSRLEQIVQSLVCNQQESGAATPPLAHEISLTRSSPEEFNTATFSPGIIPGIVNTHHLEHEDSIVYDHRSMYLDYQEPQILQAGSDANNESLSSSSSIKNQNHMSPTYLAPDDIQDDGDVDVLDGRLQSRNQLMQIFLEQVDPILPFLHCPSLCDHFIKGRPYLDYGADHPAPKALVSAVSYIAISSISDDRCLRIFGAQRQLLLAKHHKNTQSALEMADYINTNDLTVLQAFVLFLLSIRTHDQSRRAWTMLGLALRIAQSIFLQKSDPPFPVKPLEREMRQRLWHAIAFLDVQASFDCGSEPMLPSSCLMSQVFRNVNDAELFSPQCHDPSRQMSQGSYADTRFIMIIAEAQHAFRMLDLPDLAEISTTVLDINIRQHAATTFRQKALTLLAGYQPETIQFHWFVKKLVEIIHAFLKLAAFRPLRRTAHFSAPSVPRGGLLLLTIKFLHALDQFYRDQRSEPFRWFIRLFVPWHALAVAIDEVCICEDKLLQQNCRPLIERSLFSFQEQLTDVHRAMLLKPVDRFMALARPSMEIPSLNNDYLSVDLPSIPMGTDETYLY